MTKTEQDKVINRIHELYSNKRVEYLGENLFVCIDNGRRIDNREDWSKAILLDENCSEIKLQNDYHNIFHFIKGFAVVCMRGDILMNKNNTFTQGRLDGIIDKNGSEVIHCIYDKIHITMDGFVTLSKDGVRKSTSLHLISSGKFDWDNSAHIE